MMKFNNTFASKNARLFFVVCLLLCSCSKAQDSSKKKTSNSRQIFRTCLTGEPFSLHPAYGFDARSQLFIRALFEGLTRIGADGDIYPALAETIAISEDKRIYTFTLKDTVWSNGQPVQASDFAYAWKGIIASDSGATLCDLLYLIKNAKAIKEKKAGLDEVGIEVVDSKTLRVELEHPASYFLHLLANPIFSPVCQQVDLSYPKWHRQKEKNFVCNGPFCIKQRDASKIILEKNPLYHDVKNVQLTDIRIHFVDDPNTIYLMFEKGEIDWVGEPFEKLPLETLPDLIRKRQLQMHPIAKVYWMLCNSESFPLNSSNIRKALAYSINREKLTQNVFIGSRPAFSVAPDMLSCLDQEDKSQDYNNERANFFFQKGLEELNLTKENFPCLELQYCPQQKVLVQILQEQWRKKLGIKVKLLCSEWNICFQNYTARQFQIGPVGWSSFIEDPIYHLQTFRERSNASNWCSWESDAYRRLIDLSDNETDESLRKEQLKQAEQILLEEMPVIPLYYEGYKFVKKENVHHAPFTHLGEFELKWVSVD